MYFKIINRKVTQSKTAKFCKGFINKSLCISVLYLYLFLFFSPLFSQDSITKVKKITLNGYVKDMQTVLIDSINGNWMTDNLIHNRLNLNWFIAKPLTFNCELRNRFMFGDFEKNIPHYDSIIKSDNGFLRLNSNLLSKKSFIFNSCIDRLKLDFTFNKLLITLGRQRINWGQTFVWNPNDIFNSYSFFDFDYEERPGSDAIRFQYHYKETSRMEFALKADRNKKLTYSGLISFNRWNYDFQLITGELQQQDVLAGGGWSGDLLKGTFRGELTYFHPVKNYKDTSGIFLASLGYDYAFKNSLSLQFEMLFNSNGSNKSDLSFKNYYYRELNIKNISFTKYSFFASLSYPLNPLLNGSLSTMYSPNDNSLFLIPNISYSLSNNADLSLVSQLFYNIKTSSFDACLIFIRLKLSF